MILAAGLGTRMQPLSALRAKPALPVHGRPVIVCLLDWLAYHGVREVLINLHCLPDSIKSAVERWAPRHVRIEYSEEEAPLGTGGGIRRARAFLAQSDPSIVVAGDMLLDLDLAQLVAEHRRRVSSCTLVLADDPRGEAFGTIGIDADGGVRRIARRFDLGAETRCGAFLGVRLFSPAILETMPESEAFEDLSDWLAPRLAEGDRTIRGLVLEQGDYSWAPVGTPQEYLSVNLLPPTLSFYGSGPPTPERLAIPGAQLLGPDADLVVGPGAELGDGARLSRMVIWEDEYVPHDVEASGGVFAGGRFYDCEGSEPTHRD
jgi:NDP-sugar pyrophosphorylase family protein